MTRKLYDEFGDRIYGEGDLTDPITLFNEGDESVPINTARNWQDRVSVATRTPPKRLAQYALNPADNSIYNTGRVMPRGPAMQTITGSITKVEVIWKGVVTDSVPAGEKFDVRVYFSANNPGGGNWTVAATVIGTDGTNAHFDVFNVTLATSKTGSFLIQDAASVSSPFTMPNVAQTLRITLWAYPFSVGGTDFRNAVPQSQW